MYGFEEYVLFILATSKYNCCHLRGFGQIYVVPFCDGCVSACGNHVGQICLQVNLTMQHNLLSAPPSLQSIDFRRKVKLMYRLLNQSIYL